MLMSDSSHNGKGSKISRAEAIKVVTDTVLSDVNVISVLRERRDQLMKEGDGKIPFERWGQSTGKSPKKWTPPKSVTPKKSLIITPARSISFSPDADLSTGCGVSAPLSSPKVQLPVSPMKASPGRKKNTSFPDSSTITAIDNTGDNDNDDNDDNDQKRARCIERQQLVNDQKRGRCIERQHLGTHASKARDTMRATTRIGNPLTQTTRTPGR